MGEHEPGKDDDLVRRDYDRLTQHNDRGWKLAQGAVDLSTQLISEAGEASRRIEALEGALLDILLSWHGSFAEAAECDGERCKRAVAALTGWETS